jgi:hypothetical protein
MPPPTAGKDARPLEEPRSLRVPGAWAAVALLPAALRLLRRRGR